MIQMNGNLVENEGEAFEKYVEAIRHFRGFVNKERFNDDVTFLREFVQEMKNDTHERCQSEQD